MGEKPVRHDGSSGVAGLIPSLRTLSGPGQDLVMSGPGHSQVVIIEGTPQHVAAPYQWSHHYLP